MGKAKQNKKKASLKRRQMIEEVFKKNKKAREIAKKFDDKIAQKQGSGKKKEKIELREKRDRKKVANKERIAELDKKFDEIRVNRKPGQSIL